MGAIANLYVYRSANPRSAHARGRIGIAPYGRNGLPFRRDLEIVKRAACLGAMLEGANEGWLEQSAPRKKGMRDTKRYKKLGISHA